MSQLYKLSIPLVVIFVAIIGGLLTTDEMLWYKTLTLPYWTPSGFFISTVWNIIFVLVIFSLCLLWCKTPHDRRFWQIMGLFILNGVLNIGWSLIFFTFHSLGWAVVEAAILGLSVAVLIILIWPRHRIAALLLIPYVSWVFFATYLSYNIWLLNN